MDHPEHVWLIRAGVEGSGPRWADLGAGTGAFTLALADVLGPAADIVAIDRDERALRTNEAAMQAGFPEANVRYLVADFREPLGTSGLDGVVMANSLHFQRDQARVVAHVKEHLAPGGRFVLVEYNITRGNGAVPYPVPFTRWETLARDAGFEHTQLLERRPSRWWSEMYSAVSW